MARSSLGVFIFLLIVGLATPGVSVWAATSKATQKEASSAKKVGSSKSASPKKASNRKKSSSRKVVKSRKSKPIKTVKRRSAAAYASDAAAGAVMTVGDRAGLNRVRDELDLASNVALVVDQESSTVLFAKNSTAVLPIASLTKLMTALVVMEAGQAMDELLTVTTDDIDRIKGTGSRLHIGARLSRDEMLHIALMSSENRAASALGRHYPGGLSAFVAAMNRKAAELGMMDSRFVEPTGLSSENVSSARDLVKLVMAAYEYPLLRKYSTGDEAAVIPGRHTLKYRNSNRLVGNPDWEIGLQKTGYISEAGRCLVMQAVIEGRPVVMVFLDSKGKLSRLGDAGRIRKWLEENKFSILTSASAALSS
jgi:D-alanyl-D-alanine endopeptidase (penicillin-binding protein 7)